MAPSHLATIAIVYQSVLLYYKSETEIMEQISFDKWLDEQGEAIGNWFDANEKEMARLHADSPIKDRKFIDFAIFLYLALPQETKRAIAEMGASGPSIAEIQKGNSP